MHDVIGRHRMITQKLLNGGGFVTRTGCCVGKTGHRFVVVTAATSPGIIAVVSHQHQRRMFRIAVGFYVGRDFRCSVRAVSVDVTDEVTHRHHVYFVGGTRSRVDVLRFVCLIAVRSRQMTSATILHTVVPVYTVDGHPVGAVGSIAVAVDVVRMHIVGQRACQVAVGNDRPLHTAAYQCFDDSFREGTFCRPVTFGVVAVIFVGNVLMGFYLFDQGAFAHQRRKGMVVGKAHHIQAREISGRFPSDGFLVGIHPARCVAPLIFGSERLHIFQQSGRNTQLSTGVGQVANTVDGIARYKLVSLHAVVFGENFLQVVGGMCHCAAGIHVAATHLQAVRFLHKLFAVRFILTLIGPVHRLIHVPEIGSMHFLSCNILTYYYGYNHCNADFGEQ